MHLERGRRGPDRAVKARSPAQCKRPVNRSQCGSKQQKAAGKCSLGEQLVSYFEYGSVFSVSLDDAALL